MVKYFKKLISGCYSNPVPKGLILFLETKIYRELLQKVEIIIEKKLHHIFPEKQKKQNFCTLIKSYSLAEYYGRSFGKIKASHIHQWF